MEKYSTEFKLEIIKAVLEDHISRCEAARKYGVNRKLVQRWVSMYESFGVEAIERKVQKYTPDFKVHVVEDMLENKLSLIQTIVKYNIASDSSVREWRSIYNEMGAEGFYKSDKSKGAAKHDNAIEDIMAENQRLRMENDYLKKLNALIQDKRK